MVDLTQDCLIFQIFLNLRAITSQVSLKRLKFSNFLSPLRLPIPPYPRFVHASYKKSKDTTVCHYFTPYLITLLNYKKRSTTSTLPNKKYAALFQI